MAGAAHNTRSEARWRGDGRTSCHEDGVRTSSCETMLKTCVRIHNKLCDSALHDARCALAFPHQEVSSERTVLFTRHARMFQTLVRPGTGTVRPSWHERWARTKRAKDMVEHIILIFPKMRNHVEQI